MGYLVVSVAGRQLERFVNLMAASGIIMWDIKRQGTVLTGKLSIGDFLRLRPIARKTHSRVRICRKAGFPFLWARARRRTVLVLGAIIFVSGVWFLSQFVWFVEINGCETLDPNVIRQVAEELGLKRGVFKHSLDLDRIGDGLALRIERVAWAGIDYAGTLAIVDIIEKELAPSPEPVGVRIDLVASKEGMVEEVVVLRGTATVRRGQTVRAGDLLIRGIAGEQLPGEGYPHVQPIPVKARGIVKARIWYTGRARVPLELVRECRTGRHYQRLVMKAGRQEIILWGWRLPFEAYDAVATSSDLGTGRIFGFPIEITKIDFYELERAVYHFSSEEARQEAIRIASNIALSRVPQEAEIILRSVQAVTQDEMGVEVEVMVETLENIATYPP